MCHIEDNKPRASDVDREARCEELDLLAADVDVADFTDEPLDVILFVVVDILTRNDDN